MALEVKKINYLVGMDQIMFKENFFGIQKEDIKESIQSTCDLFNEEEIRIEKNPLFELQFSNDLWYKQQLQTNAIINKSSEKDNKITESLRFFYGNSIGQVIAQLQNNTYFVDILDDYSYRLVFLFHKESNIVYVAFVRNEIYASDQNHWHEACYKGEANQLLTYLFCLQLGKELRENGCTFDYPKKLNHFSNKPWPVEKQTKSRAQGYNYFPQVLQKNSNLIY